MDSAVDGDRSDDAGGRAPADGGAPGDRAGEAPPPEPRTASGTGLPGAAGSGGGPLDPGAEPALALAVQAFLTGYFSTHRRSERTVRAYTTDLAQFEAWAGADAPVTALGPDLLERWAAELEERDYASSSIRRKFATLRVFFGYLVRREVIDRSPLWNVRLDLAPEKVLPRTLSLTEARRLLDRAAQEVAEARPGRGPVDRAFLAVRNRAILEVMFATGIRVGEAASLELGDVRREDDELLIRGKGARQRLAILFPPRVGRALDAYLRRRSPLDLAHSSLFVNAFRGPLSAQGIAGMLARLAEGAGIRRRVTPHMLRHTVATLLLRNGADLRIVQEFLGHASISTTERYTHVTKEHLVGSLVKHHPYLHMPGG